MSNLYIFNKSFGKRTLLTIKVSLTCSILTFICALLCYYIFNIKGIIVYTLLAYSFLNFLNIILFYKYRKLELTYNIMSILAFLVTYIICLFSDGINSPFSSFLVLIIFSGYATSLFYGDLWLVIIFFAVISLFIINISEYKFYNYVTEESRNGFNFFFLMFLIILLGGVFGRLMSKNNDRIYKTKKEIARKNEEKTVMLKEIHHRVKNNLQVINSLLRIQSRGIEDENVKLIFKLTQNRVVAMARLHEKIYNTKNMMHIDVEDHFKVLVRDLIHSYNIDKNIVSKFEIAPVKMSINTLLPLSLITNELVSNSLKSNQNGVLIKQIKLKLCAVSDKQFELIISDNCAGACNSVSLESTNSAGAQLIQTFLRQLNGKIEDLSETDGSSFRISFSCI